MNKDFIIGLIIVFVCLSGTIKDLTNNLPAYEMITIFPLLFIGLRLKGKI